MTEHASTGAAGDGTPSPTAAEATAPGPTDPKERFRLALARKKAAGHRTADGVAANGAVHGPEVTGGGKRTFRRKTG